MRLHLRLSKPKEKKLKIQVILECESEKDREELWDCQTDFEALQSGSIDYDFDVIVDSGSINVLPTPGEMYIYCRRES